MPKNKYLLLLISAFAVLALVNFPWGRWFLGWDNLVPEFNFSANIQRAIFSLWQENEGLGLIGGHGYAATLLHSLALFIASIFTPINYLRSIFTLMMLLLGSLGSFYLARILLEKKEEKIQNKIAFIAGLFYMLNFATVQMFYIPLEAFCVHFSALPWLLYSLVMIFKNPNKRNLFIFSVISLLSSPQGFIPPLFIIYSMFLVIFCISFLFKNRTLTSAKLVTLIMTITVFMNAYWLLPVTYYSMAKSQIYLNSYNNQTTTDDFVYKSKKYGDLDNVVSLKGLIYDAFDSKGTENILYIFQPWRNHLENTFSYIIFYLIFFIILFGIIDTLTARSLYRKIFILFFLISFTYLATDVFPFSIISEILRNNIPILKQAFRIGFTKFSISLALFYSLFFAFGIFALTNKIDKLNKRKLNTIIYVGILVLIFYLSLPAFSGYFFYNRIKLKFPEDYNQVFNFFNSQDADTRIADFPQVVPTGWSIYSWDYTGSGFWWYGLNQPILDRNFDVWSNFNENYYWELSQAIYSGNTDILSRIFQKYQVKWLLIDRNLVSFISQKAIYIDKLEQMLSNMHQVNLIHTSGKIKIYKVSLDQNIKDFVFLANNLPAVGPQYKWNNFDKAYEEYGNYISNNKTDIFYPFRSLFTGRQQDELEFGVEDTEDYFSFKTKIPKELQGYKLVLPRLLNQDMTEFDASDLSKTKKIYPQIFLDGEFVLFVEDGSVIDFPYIKEGNLEARVPKIHGYYSYNFDPATINSEPKTCNQFNKGEYKHDRIDENGNKLLRLTSINSSNCLDFDLPNLSQDIGYLITVKNRNIEGKSLLFSVINKNSQRADMETYLPKKLQVNTSYFVIPPMEQYGLGYTLHLDNISIGRVKTINDVGKITVNPIPYRFLTGLKIIKDINQLPITSYQLPISVDHPNPSLYQIALSKQQTTNNNTTLVLSQSYDDGWKAYQVNNSASFIQSVLPFILGTEIKNHVLVNNWENGWILKNEKIPQCSNDQCNIIVVYLPQYLEYIGFILLGIGLLIVILHPESTINHQPPTIN